MRNTLLAISAAILDDTVLNFNEKNYKKKKKKLQKKKKKKYFYSRAGQKGRSDEDKQTIFFGLIKE